MVPYKTTQKSWVHYLLFPLMIILILFTRHFTPWLLGLLGGFTVILFLFHSLILEVDRKQLKVKFGPGLFYKKINLEDIADCQPITLPWQYRFGLHFNPDFTVYNVTGKEAVEIKLKNKTKTIRIGTDEPEYICRYIMETHNDEQD